jgi:hypothetical protein
MVASCQPMISMQLPIENFRNSFFTAIPEKLSGIEVKKVLTLSFDSSLYKYTAHTFPATCSPYIQFIFL